MAEEIELKKAGKAQTANQMRRNAILNSNTKLGNQASVISPKTNIIQRSFLANPYLTQAAKSVFPAVASKALGLLAMIGTPTQLADGTIPDGYIKELQALEARLKAKRETEQLAAAKAKLRMGSQR